jgi:hypothetical protein
MGEHKRPRRAQSTYFAHLYERLRLGVLVGLALAALYCAYALALFAVRGSAPFAKNEVTLPLVLATYAASGIAGGVAYGVLHPLGRTMVGRVVLAVLIGTLVFFGLTVATDGLPSHWTRDSWEQTVILGGLMGIPIGLLWRRVTGL